MKTNVVSHSMAEGFAKCRKQFEIQHVKKLMPKDVPSGLRRGNTGHAFFDEFFKAIQKGLNVEVAKANGLKNMMDYKHVTPELIPMMMNWVEREWPKYSRRWEVLEVEKTYHIKIRDEDTLHYFPFTIDLLVRDLVTGETILIDHKCLYDPYNETTMNVLPQQPKYVGALRALGISVDRAFYNVIRTRKLKEGYESFLTEIPLTNERIKTSMKDQIAIMREIANEPTYYRTANSMNCGGCSVAMLCIAEQNNEDVETIAELHFEPNEYGYTVEDLENV